MVVSPGMEPSVIISNLLIKKYVFFNILIIYTQIIILHYICDEDNCFLL